MGVSLEIWRARIGTFVQPPRLRNSLNTDTARHHRNSRNRLDSDARPMFLSLCTCTCLFMLLVSQCVERNPGPVTGTGNRGRGASQRGGRPSLDGRTHEPDRLPTNSQRELRANVRQTRPESRTDRASLNTWLNSAGTQDRGDIENDAFEAPTNLEEDPANNPTNVMSLLLEIRREVKTTNKKFDSLQQSVTELQQDNAMLKEQNEKLTEEVSTLTEQMSQVETKLDSTTRKQDALEKVTKRQNLKIFNLKDEVGSSLETTITSQVNETLDLSEDENSIEYTYRLPGKSTPRPILLRCSSVKIKERILSAFRTKRQAGESMSFRIGDDLPENVSKARTLLYPFFKECLDNGKRAFFKHDYLMVDDVKYVYDHVLKTAVPADR